MDKVRGLVRKLQAGKRTIIASAFSTAIVGLSLCQAMAAQSTVSARIVWYGIYTTSASKEIDDPDSPTGKRYVSTPVPPAVNSDRIPVEELRFGIGYVLSARARAVTVKHVYRFPPGGIVDRSSGQTSTGTELVEQHNTGEVTLMGWNMAGASMVPGVWTFEVWYGDRKLLEKQFTLYMP